MIFNKEYTEYWQSATSKSIDGLRIPGPPEVHQLLPLLKIEKGQKVLDMGCSYGRMHKELALYSDDIYGVDIDPYAVEKAKENPYTSVTTGTAEDTKLSANSFDSVFCWQVFDVVNQFQGFREISRILKNGGRFLVTGKNYDYDPQDTYAFKAEKNAFLKGFPNRFTKIDRLIKETGKMGFVPEKLLMFANRGDFGMLRFTEPSFNESSYPGYEYLLICTKKESFSSDIENNDLETFFSLPATKKAQEKGFANAEELFKSIGID